MNATCTLCRRFLSRCAAKSLKPPILTYSSVPVGTVLRRCQSKLFYEGDELYKDKSYTSFLDKEAPQLTLITEYSADGFIMNSKNKVLGPMVLLPGTIIQWNVRRPEDITIEYLVPFTVLHPGIDLLVLGTGDKVVPLPEEARAFLRKHGISVEVQSTRNAAATYNFLMNEERTVAGAFLLITEAQPEFKRSILYNDRLDLRSIDKELGLEAPEKTEESVIRQLEMKTSQQTPEYSNDDIQTKSADQNAQTGSSEQNTQTEQDAKRTDK